MSSRKGFTQVEPNHISGIVTGQILAQLPVDQVTMGKVIENGRFAKYDYANNVVNLTGDGEWMMIYNEEKLYDERKQNHKDFAMVAEDYVDSVITPRLISTVLGDIFTTNAIHDAAVTVTDINKLTDSQEDTWTMPAVGTSVYVGTDGYLATTGDTNGPVFQVVKQYTMADGQDAVKLMRIK